MRTFFYACIAIISLTVISDVQLYAHGYPFQLFKSNKDPFKAYKDHIDGIKDYMDTFKVETVSFPVQKDAHSRDTFIRKGFLTLRPNALGTVVICHGYTHSKHEAFFFRTLFPHFHVLAFDFRAHGDLIEGQQSTIGRDEMFDVKGAVDFVKSHPELQGKPVIGFGFSMGAVSLLQAQSHFQDLFDLMIMDSPFDSSSDCMGRSIDKILTVRLFGQRYKLPGKWLFMKALYNPYCRPMIKQFFAWASGMNPNAVPTKFVPVIPLDHAYDIKIPCMFITCENDKSVTVDRVRRLYDAVSAPYKRLWITSGPSHCGSCLAQPELYSYKVNRFIKNALDASWDEAAKIRDDRVSIHAA